MSPTKRIPLLVTVLLAVLLAGAHQAENADAKNTYEVDNRNRVVTITVNVVLIGNPEKVAFLQQAFNSYWGKPDGFKYGCYTVKLVLKVERGTSPEAGKHTVKMNATNPGDPWVSTVSPAEFNPQTTDAVGNWSDWDDANIVAHEFGHILGLPDEYSYNDKNNDRRRNFDEHSYPDPKKAPEYTWTDKEPKNNKIDAGEVTLKSGQGRSLMAEWADGSSQVLQRHINAIVNDNVPRGAIDSCPGKGSGKLSSVPLNDESRRLTRDADFEFEFAVDEDGKVSGQITLTYAAVLTVENLPSVNVGIASFDPDVGGEITDPNPTRTFDLGGTLADGALTLEIATPESERPPIEFTIRADPGVSAGLDPGGSVLQPPGSEIQIIKIDMTPFTPFAGEAVPVEDGEAHFVEAGEDYEVQWDAEIEGDAGEPVG